MNHLLTKRVEIAVVWIRTETHSGYEPTFRASMYTIADLPIENTLQTVEYDLGLESALRQMFENSYT